MIFWPPSSVPFSDFSTYLERKWRDVMVLTVYVWTYETLILVLPFELGCIISFYCGTRGSEEMIGSYRETIKDYWAFIKKEWTVGQATLTLEGLCHRQMWIILTIHNSLLLMRVLMTMTIWLIAALFLFRAHYGPSPTINALCVPSQLILISLWSTCLGLFYK